MDAVTAVLIDRSKQAERIGSMVTLSLVAHVVLVTAIALMPHRPIVDENASKRVMTISLAGALGPVQGRNAIASKPVQQAVPEDVKPKNDAPPALAKPEMVEAVKNAKTPPKTQTKDVAKTEPQLHGRTPTQGAEVKAGKARVDTQSALPFGTGLATGGAGGGQAYTDYADFCCPEYIDTLRQRIIPNWRQNQGVAGTNKMKFTILRNGTIADIQVETSAGQFLDLASQRALELTKQVPPLPAAFTHDKLVIHLEFEYKR